MHTDLAPEPLLSGEIVIVEDDLLQRDLVSDIVEEMGISYRAFVTCDEAFSAANNGMD